MNLFDQDKAGHFIVGSAVAAVVAMAAAHAGYSAPLMGICAALGVGVGKEISDYVINRRRAKAGQTPSHTVDGGDLIATTLGAFPVALPLIRWEF
jgi:Na+-driven multidrug efflux pump